MREILSISIDKNLKNRVEEASVKYKISKSELIKKAIEKYIAHTELREIRNILVPRGEEAGYYTDEDVFDDIS